MHKPWQKWIYSVVNQGELDQQYCCFKKFFTLNQISNENDFFYHVMRLNIHFRLKKSNELIWQHRNRIQRILLKNSLTLQQIYSRNYVLGQVVTTELVESIQAELNRLDKKSEMLDRLLTELEYMNEDDFRNSFFYIHHLMPSVEKNAYLSYTASIKTQYRNISTNPEIWY